MLGKIDDALDDLLLPYTFSLVILGEKLDCELAGHIKRVGYPIYERAAPQSATSENRRR